MRILSPYLMMDKLTELTPSFLAREKISGILLDVDNTMTTHGHPHPADGVIEWVEEMRRAEIKLIIVSNNTPQRVEPFARMFGLDFVANGRKPFTKGFREACRRLQIKPKEAVCVGDQIFTDILGGNLLGAKTILTTPIEPEHMPFFRFKRWAEKPIIRSHKRKVRS